MDPANAVQGDHSLEVGSTEINLAHQGLYKDLQTVAPSATWQKSFWARPSGF